MTSTPLQPDAEPPPPEWVAQGHKFFPLATYFRRQFGHRVWKISVDAGLSCPNLDGTLAHGGCIFCDAQAFSPSRRLGGAVHSVAEQIADGAARLRRRYGEKSANAFIAYFQPATNTYGPVEQLRDLWQQALSQPNVVGLAIGTRPDCADDGVLDNLSQIAQNSWVCVEFGLQTIHQKSLDWLRRGHDFACFKDAVGRAKARGLHVGVHLILGLPGESREQMMETAEAIARLGVDMVKLHNLYVVADTPLAKLWEQGELQLPSAEEYAQIVVDFLERLPETCVIDRLVGDAPPQYLVAPDWCRHKAALRHQIEQEFTRRNTRQGSRQAPH